MSSDKGGPKKDAPRKKKDPKIKWHAKGKWNKAGIKPAHSTFMYRWLKPSRKIGQGGVIPKTAALGRLVKWPRYIKLQRQRKVLLQRLKIPPALNVFNQACSKDFASKLVRFCKTYRPETKKQKVTRLRALAKLQAEGKPLPTEKPKILQFGFNHVTHLIEQGRAELVLIAHDVDPIELVLWMPALCVKKNVPFVIFKCKGRLGSLVNRKSVACVAVTNVKTGDKADLAALKKRAAAAFNARYNTMKKQWGKKILGYKTRKRMDKRRRFALEERAKRKQAMARGQM